MSGDHVLLVGSEEVRRAASVISDAAGKMQRAADHFVSGLDRMAQLVERFEAACDRLAAPPVDPR